MRSSTTGRRRQPGSRSTPSGGRLMLEHLNSAPQKPSRVVVMGSGSFVGGAILERLAKEGVPSVGLSRKEVALLAPDAGHKLAARLKPGDALVAVAARAPVKN